MDRKENIITTKVSLTEQQRTAIAKALNIESQYVPQELGIVGMPNKSAKSLGMPDLMKAKFSPALMMT